MIAIIGAVILGILFALVLWAFLHEPKEKHH
jgi:hypothetical protein